jgi:glycosyltransferase involved in cell wall biosynthesis
MAHWIWEQTTLPDRTLAQLELVDEVWIASEFVRETYRSSTVTSTVLMPQVATRERQDGHDIWPHDGGPTARSRFGIPEDRFVFLTIASALSSHVRKNPVGAMHAFRAAFPHGQREAVLVIKLLPTEGELGDLGVFTEDPAFGPDVHLLVESLTDDEMTELLQSCACFVSLHRNEGFGLGATEAMSLGRPAIITAWSGSVDYTTETNCLVVPFTLRRIEDPGLPWYAPGLEWAEPDLEVAASYMRRVVEEPDLAERLGTQGRIDIWNAYSVEAVSRAISTHLESLYRR